MSKSDSEHIDEIIDRLIEEREIIADFLSDKPTLGQFNNIANKMSDLDKKIKVLRNV